MRFLLCTLLLAFTLTPNQKLIDTGREYPVKSILTGQPNAILQREAEQHAAYQARVQVQGHQGWNARYQRLARQLPDCDTFKEVANESWPGQNVNDAAAEMYHSWKQSPGHWSAVNGSCTYYGYAMVRGKNGVWYACGLFADRRK
jgi:uncharacterized protein YkwD